MRAPNEIRCDPVDVRTAMVHRTPMWLPSGPPPVLSDLDAEQDSEAEGGTDRREPSDRLTCALDELEDAQPE